VRACVRACVHLFHNGAGALCEGAQIITTVGAVDRD